MIRSTWVWVTYSTLWPISRYLIISLFDIFPVNMFECLSVLTFSLFALWLKTSRLDFILSVDNCVCELLPLFTFQIL